MNKIFFTSMCIFLIPVCITVLVGNLICFKNYKEYGLYTVNNKFYYNKAMDSMKKVKAINKIERVSFTREKLNRIAETTILANIIEIFNPILDGYAKFDGNQLDNEVENGWFGFPLRDLSPQRSLPA